MQKGINLLYNLNKEKKCEVRYVRDIIEFLVNSIRNISIWSILDISVVAFICYKGYMLVKETRAEQLLKGIFLVIALFPISYILKFKYRIFKNINL